MFSEEGGRQLGSFSASVLISKVSNLQEYLTPLSGPEKGEIRIRVSLRTFRPFQISGLKVTIVFIGSNDLFPLS